MNGRRQRALTTIADELDELEQRRTALFERRRKQWLVGSGEGDTTAELARASRVKPVTVRALLARAEAE